LTQLGILAGMTYFNGKMHIDEILRMDKERENS